RDAVLVVSLLDERRHHTRRADPVAAHDERPLLTVLGEKGRIERLREARLELEDVTDLDRGLEAQPTPAVRARVALRGLAEVGEPRLEVAAGRDAPQVETVAVRACDELPVAERLV